MVTREELLDLMNEAIAREIQVSIQYMWNHVMANNRTWVSLANIFKQIAIVEMKHAEAIAERLYFLGRIPTTKPAEIKISENLDEVIDFDIKAEEEAIDLYKRIIEVAMELKDYTTKKLFEDILRDEEEHLDIFQNMKGKQ